MNRIRVFKEKDFRGLILFGILLVLVVIFAFLTPHFFSLRNFMNIGMYSASITVAAIGVTFVMISGGIDISIGASLPKPDNV